MTVYILQYFIWFFICKSVIHTRTRIRLDRHHVIDGKGLCIFIFFAYVAFLTCFRDPSVGVDSAMYAGIFMNTASYSNLIDLLNLLNMSAPVHTAYEWLASRIMNDVQMHFISNSLVIAICFAIYIHKRSKNVWFSCFLYVGLILFYTGMNVMRQYMAMALAITAYMYLTENLKSFKGWLFFLLALGIHNTSMFLLPGILATHIFRNKPLRKSTFYIIFGSIIMMLVIFRLVDVFVSIFPRYESYVGGEGLYQITNSLSGGRIIVFYIFLGMIVFLHALRSWHSKKTFIDYPCVLFGTIMGIFFAKNAVMNRLLLYYTMIFLSFIPETFSRYPKREQTILYFACFIGLATYAMLHLLENKSGVVPYKFFFS